MTAKPVRLRVRARLDVEEAVDHHADQAGTEVAMQFVEALERACRVIEDSPGAGSPHFAHELGIAGLRSQRVRRFPYLIFYVERAQHLDVWRVLHARRDIPVWMAAEPD